MMERGSSNRVVPTFHRPTVRRRRQGACWISPQEVTICIGILMPCTITIRSFLWTHTEYLKTPRNLPAFSQNHPTLIAAAVTARSIPCDPKLARRVTFLPEMEHTTFRTNLTSAPDLAGGGGGRGGGGGAGGRGRGRAQD